MVYAQWDMGFTKKLYHRVIPAKAGIQTWNC